MKKTLEDEAEEFTVKEALKIFAKMYIIPGGLGDVYCIRYNYDRELLKELSDKGEDNWDEADRYMSDKIRFRNSPVARSVVFTCAAVADTIKLASWIYIGYEMYKTFIN